MIVITRRATQQHLGWGTQREGEVAKTSISEQEVAEQKNAS